MYVTRLYAASWTPILVHSAQVIVGFVELAELVAILAKFSFE